MSYSAATGTGTSVDDLELEPASRLDAAGADDRAQRARESALAADHLADVVLGDVQPEDERAVVAPRTSSTRTASGSSTSRRASSATSSATRYSMPWILRSFATVSVGCAPFSSQPRTFSSSRSMSDGSDCGL